MRLKISDCRHPWDNLQILTTGDVRVCCWSNKPVGNLNKNSLDEIWNGDEMKILRESVENDKVHDLCKNAACPYIQQYLKK
jgi:MoaA/NifB/PqqE/SkfB family radical SAM enzyme